MYVVVQRSLPKCVVKPAASKNIYYTNGMPAVDSLFEGKSVEDKAVLSYSCSSNFAKLIYGSDSHTFRLRENSIITFLFLLLFSLPFRIVSLLNLIPFIREKEI